MEILEDQQNISKKNFRKNQRTSTFHNLLQDKNHLQMELFYCENRLKNQKKIHLKKTRPNKLIVQENA